MNDPSAGTAASFVVIVGAGVSGEDKNQNAWSPPLDAASIARSFDNASRAIVLRMCSPSNASMAARHRV